MPPLRGFYDREEAAEVDDHGALGVTRPTTKI
jgi:hypothetical protein